MDICPKAAGSFEKNSQGLFLGWRRFIFLGSFFGVAGDYAVDLIPLEVGQFFEHEAYFLIGLLAEWVLFRIFNPGDADRQVLCLVAADYDEVGGPLAAGIER